MSDIRILVVDDHSLVREGIVALLRLQTGFEVVGEAAEGRSAIRLAESLNPDIILMDISMPGLGGLEATLEIRKSRPTIRIIVLSQYDDAQYISRFLKAGVSGYVLKGAAGSELVSAVRAVAAGQSYLHPSIAAQVIDGYINPKDDFRDPYELLTDREKQILKLIAEGHTHKEVGSELGISSKTAIAHQTKISEKLGIRSKAEFIKFAIARGIIRIPDASA